MKHKKVFLTLTAIAFSALIFAQQVPDTGYYPSIPSPEYSRGEGPAVYIDGAHSNFHTRDGGYLPFARLLESDGYRVYGFEREFSTETLDSVSILVIANALNPYNATRWYKPVLSAFTNGEITALKRWVKKGGSLFLIADHMPMGGAAKKLAASFGFGFTDGFAVDTASSGPAFFHLDDATLNNCSITSGRNPGESVDKVVSFTGQAFTIPPGATPVLQFNDKYLLLESDTAWVFDSSTRFTPITGWAQGAYMEYGKGRIVMFGEAAMFTAQLAGAQQLRAGMNSDFADQNYRLLLNIIHWLDKKY